MEYDIPFLETKYSTISSGGVLTPSPDPILQYSKIQIDSAAKSVYDNWRWLTACRWMLVDDCCAADTASSDDDDVTPADADDDSDSNWSSLL